MIVTAPTKTRRQVFDEVKAHLLKQGRKATEKYQDYVSGNGWVLNGERCLYRAAGGGKCAAGALIADEHYFPAMEGSGVGSRYVDAALMKSGVSDADLDFVALLQRIHDHRPPESWAEDLDALERETFGEAVPCAP